MRYHGLATDFDETLAEHGKVNAKTLAALQRARDSGRKLVLVTGHTDREIGAALFISPRTAQGHVASIFAKLGVNSRAAATAVAVRANLVPESEKRGPESLLP